MANVTKADITLAVSNQIEFSEIPKYAIEGIIEAALRVIGGALAAHQNVELRGFGTFKPKHVQARTGRNPRTGEAVEIPARWTAKFKPGKELDAALKES